MALKKTILCVVKFVKYLRLCLGHTGAPTPLAVYNPEKSRPEVSQTNSGHVPPQTICKSTMLTIQEISETILENIFEQNLKWILQRTAFSKKIIYGPISVPNFILIHSTLFEKSRSQLKCGKNNKNTYCIAITMSSVFYVNDIPCYLTSC